MLCCAVTATQHAYLHCSQTPSTTTCGGRQSQEVVEGHADGASRQQLQQLADAMQQQLDMLAQAVAELKQVWALVMDQLSSTLAAGNSQLDGTLPVNKALYQ